MSTKKELRDEAKRLKQEIKSYYRIYNFLTIKQEEHLIKIAERLEGIEKQIKEDFYKNE